MNCENIREQLEDMLDKKLDASGMALPLKFDLSISCPANRGKVTHAGKMIHNDGNSQFYDEIWEQTKNQAKILLDRVQSLES